MTLDKGLLNFSQSNLNQKNKRNQEGSGKQTMILYKNQ